MAIRIHPKNGFDQPILQPIHPSMQLRTPIRFPGALYDGGLRQVHDLLLYIQFRQPIAALFLIGNSIQLFAVDPVYILDL